MKRYPAICLALSLSIAPGFGQTNRPAGPVAEGPASSVAAEPKPWENIVLVGASVTAGFTASEPLGGTNSQRLSLDRYIEAALLMPHQPMQNLASALFFTQPEAWGRQQIFQAVKAKPTLIVGLDFLFWFCYGARLTDEQRLELFEKGLRLLDTVPCPVLVGDIPDASVSVRGGMLSADQVPNARVMRSVNERLSAWAAGHPRVMVLPLSRFLGTALANQSLALHRFTLAAGETSILLQQDLLHPSPPGCSVLALEILDLVAKKSVPCWPEGQVLWNPYQIYRRAFKSAQRAEQQLQQADGQGAAPHGVPEDR